MKKTIRKIKSISIAPKDTQYGEKILYTLVATDGDMFTTFKPNPGKKLEDFSEGDMVEIEFTESKKNDRTYRNFVSLKEVENDSEFDPPDDSEPEEAEKGKPKSDKQADINRAVAVKAVGPASGWFDLSKLTNKERAKFFVEFWKTIEDRLNEL